MSANEASLERGLPASLEAERSILGAILLDNTLQFEALATLKPEHFFLDAHRRIYAVAAQLTEQGKPVEIVSLTQALLDGKELEAVGGAGYLASLTDGVPRRSSLSHYVNIVRDKATLRALIHLGNAMVEQGLEQASSPVDMLGWIEESVLAERAEAQSVNAVEHVSRFVLASIEEFDRSCENTSEAAKYPFGIDTLDTITGGVKNMTVLAGRTGEGKSCVATQCVYANASKGTPVVIFSPEMTKEEVLMRMVVQTAGIPSWKYKKPHLMGRDERYRVRETFAELSKLPIYVDGTSSISAQEIAARARLANRRDHVELCVVDYIQLLEAKGRDLRTEVSNSSRHLRALAKDVMPVLALSQMPRPKDDLNKWPTKYDLKESGSLENDSFQVVVIRREIGEKNLPSGIDHMCVVKNRGGKVGVEPVQWDEDSLSYKPRLGDFS